jgi:uncharacterized protein YegP (UPF0339 family)
VPAAELEVFERPDGLFAFRVRHRNGDIIAIGGEGYADKGDAITVGTRLICGSYSRDDLPSG